jgi:hypothetical protein
MSILKKLSDARTVSFDLNKEINQMEVTENCDFWYSVSLSKIEFKQLIDELTELYSIMSEND